MKKKSMDDPIKRRWRHKEYKFIKKHREKLGDYGNLTVVFLPGADAGLVPTELEMLEKLGVKRSNMVGIEKDKNVYNKLKSRKLGINLEWVDAEEFFKNCNQNFDIISLDYSGPFSLSVEQTLKYIAGRQLLNSRSILITNLYGRMEQTDIKSLYERGVMLLHSKDVFHINEIFDNMMEDHIKSLKIPEIAYKSDKIAEGKGFSIDDCYTDRDIVEKFGYDNLEKIRKTAITSLICGTLMKGKGFFRLNPVYARNPRFNEFDKRLTDIFLETTKNAKEKNQKIPLRSGVSLITKEKIHGNIVATAVHDTYLMEYIVRKGHFPDMVIFPLYDYNCPYFVEDLESYWYRSERGSPMYSDFFYVDQHRDIFEKYREFTDKVYRDLENGPLSREKLLEKNISFLTPKEAEELILKRKEGKDLSIIKKAMNRVEGENLPERIFLGSSADRPKLDGKTYYKHRIEGLENGQDKKELWENLKLKYKTDNGQLRAYERHFKMETYGHTKIEKPVQKENYDSRSYKEIDLFRCSNPVHYLENGLLPEGAVERLKHFLEEDLPFRIEMDKGKKKKLVNNIAETNWYKSVKKNLEKINHIKDYKERKAKTEALEKQMYTFFDDIMLYCVWNEKVPGKEKIGGLLYNSLQGGKVLPERPKKPDYVPEIKKGGEEMSPSGRPYISKDAALTLLSVGHDPKEIANGYRGFTAGQLRAFKAHLTMNTYNNELTSDLAYELFGTCNLSTEEVGKAFPKVSKYKIGAYKAWDTMRKREK